MTDTPPAVDIDVELELPSDFYPMAIGIDLGEARAQLLRQLGERAGEAPDSAVDGLAKEYAAASQLLEKAGCSTPRPASGCWTGSSRSPR